MEQIWKKYELQARIKNPVKTKMITAFCLFSLGDITCQFLFEKTKKWNVKRTMTQGCIAMFVLNPMSQFYMLKVAPLIKVPCKLKPLLNDKSY